MCYMLDRDGEHVLEPVFTFHGFRYAEVVGGRGRLGRGAIAISSDLAPRSSFRSSHEALDQFHSNVFWSQRDNFVSVPTDCPQRDERLGWTGDAQAFSATASTLMDSESFWASGCATSRSTRPTKAACSSVVPDIIRPVDMLMGGVPTENMGAPAGRMPRPSCRWRYTSRTARTRSWCGSSTACAAGSSICAGARR